MQEFDIRETISLTGDGEDVGDARLYRGVTRFPPNALVELVETEVGEAVDGDVETLEVVVLPDRAKTLAYALEPTAGEAQTTVATDTFVKRAYFGVQLVKADDTVPSAPTTGSIRLRLRGRY